MASLTSAEGPDPKTFNSWEDAFQYPIPAVRRMETQLRREVTNNRDRLRTLVGNSYRDLLGTAEMIIDMDGQMRRTEMYLDSVGRRCNSRELQRSLDNVNLLHGRGSMKSQEDYANVAQLRVLHGCAQAISRALRREDCLLLAAKLLVLSRRLHKKLSSIPSTLKYVESLRGRLGKLRQKLLDLVEERLAASETEPALLLDSMCAHALATSSSCADVFRNFLQVRKDAVSSTPEDSAAPSVAARDSLTLWVRTLRDARSMFPREVSSALAKLQAQPLTLADDVRSCRELDLDNHSIWIEEDMKFFAPFIRHDDLQPSAATQQASSWARSTLARLVTNIAVSLEKIDHPRAMNAVRHDIIQLWLSNCGKLHGVSKTQVLDDLRGVFREELYTLIDRRCQAVSEVGELIQRTAEDATLLEREGHALHGLWDAATIHLHGSTGSNDLVGSVNASYRGLTASLQSTIDRYALWLTSVDEARHAIGSLCEERWDDDDFEDALSESDDDSPTRAAHVLLSEDDPKALASRFTSALTSALNSLQPFFAFSHETSSPINALKAAYLLRTLREITARTPSRQVPLPAIHTHRGTSAASPGKEVVGPLSNFSALAAPLHRAISSPLLDALFARHEKLIQRLASTTPPVRGWELWDDGTPPLPTLPSPAAFRFLRELHKALESAGPDLWTAPSIDMLKTCLRRKLADTLAAADAQMNGSAGTGEAANGEVESMDAGHDVRDNDSERSNANQAVPRAEARIQRLFDLHLLIAAGTTSSKQDPDVDKGDSELRDNDPLYDLRQQWTSNLDSDCSKLETEGAVLSATLEKRATEYWRTRIGLLFGLLYKPVSSDRDGPEKR